MITLNIEPLPNRSYNFLSNIFKYLFVIKLFSCVSEHECASCMRGYTKEDNKTTVTIPKINKSDSKPAV